MITLLCSPVTALHASGPAEKPNVLFILADDLGWSDTTLYGKTKFHQTPNIERLAKRGMTFTRAYSASPLCSPTRSAILTGLSPARTGITEPACHLPKVVMKALLKFNEDPKKKVFYTQSVTRLDTNYFTLAETLKQADYATGHFGKWHLGPEPYSPLQHGFDVDVPHDPGPGPARSFIAPWNFKALDADPGEPDQHLEDRMAKEAVAWMEKNKDRPFFLNYWMFSVHAPFDAKRALIEKHRARVNPADPQRSPTYAAMVESMDDAVGTLLDALDRLGIADKTIIVFTSDNGGNMYDQVDGTTPTSNTPLRGGKATIFDGGTRVPCVIAWPNITQPGSRSDAMIQSEDYYPTLLAGLDLAPAPDQHFDGTNFLPALKGETFERGPTFQFFPHDPAVPDWLPPSVSVHRDDWKLIRIFHDGPDRAHRHLLFNLRDDPGEKNDLAAQRPELVRELDALIEKFLINTKAVVPLPNPAFDPTKSNPAQNPQMRGWKTRDCNAAVKDGIATITGSGAEPFLAFAAGKLEAGATLRLRLKCSGGIGRVAWLPAADANPADAPKSAEFLLKADDWTETSVVIPSSGDKAANLRLFLPAQDAPVELDWIELISGGDSRRWDF